jgi:perosamine synthetase
MKAPLYYTKPSITKKELSYAIDAASNGWGNRCYEYIGRFEELFKRFTGAQYAIATSSCTGALHMGLAALNIGRGDEVILADTNWIATAAPITYLGATPVFVDILPDTWCIDPDLAEAAISPRTKAIIAVHLYGNLCEIDRLISVGERHGIPVIEDAAEAIGSRWREKHAGTMGKFGVFSFHGTKTITTGEGGMFITDDPELYEKVLVLSNHGRAASQIKMFRPGLVGFKYKMSNLEAAIGCAQIERIDELIARKREIFKYYQEGLSNVNGITMNPEKLGTVNGYWMPNVVFAKNTNITCERLLKTFQFENIDGREFFPPLSSLPMFASKSENFNSYDIPERAINLPSYHDLTMNDMERVIAIIESL